MWSTRAYVYERAPRGHVDCWTRPHWICNFMMRNKLLLFKVTEQRTEITHFQGLACLILLIPPALFRAESCTVLNQQWIHWLAEVAETLGVNLFRADNCRHRLVFMDVLIQFEARTVRASKGKAWVGASKLRVKIQVCLTDHWPLPDPHYSSKIYIYINMYKYV